jgi:hypothetical protein
MTGKIMVKRSIAEAQTERNEVNRDSEEAAITIASTTVATVPMVGKQLNERFSIYVCLTVDCH